MNNILIVLLIGACSITSLGAESNLENASKETSKISKLELLILKRSILLLGANNRPNVPKFTLMHYHEKERELNQYYTVTPEQVDKVLSGDKKTRDAFLFRYKMERSSFEAGYLKFNSDDIFKMTFSVIGGGKSFSITKDGIQKNR